MYQTTGIKSARKAQFDAEARRKSREAAAAALRKHEREARKR